MAVQKRKKTSDKKNKKKIWFEIIAPKTFKEVSLGNTLAYSLDEIKGRSIKVNLMKVTSNMKNQNVNVTFIINETRDNKGYTELVSYVFVPSSIKRLVRRGKSRVDDSFVCRTKDGKTIRVKSLMITRSITTKAVNTMLRKENKKLLLELFSTHDSDSFVSKLILHSIQNQQKNALKKIYPLRLYEIRDFSIQGVSKSQNKIEVKEKNNEVKKEEKTEVKKETLKEEAKKTTKKVKEEVKKDQTEKKETKEETKKKITE